MLIFCANTLHGISEPIEEVACDIYPKLQGLFKSAVIQLCTI